MWFIFCVTRIHSVTFAFSITIVWIYFNKCQQGLHRVFHFYHSKQLRFIFMFHRCVRGSFNFDVCTKWVLCDVSSQTAVNLKLLHCHLRRDSMVIYLHSRSILFNIHCCCSLNLHRYSIKLLTSMYMYFFFIRNNLIYLKVMTSHSSAEILSR